MTRFLTRKDASVFIQFELGKETHYLGDCITLDAIPNPQLGGVNLIQCWNRSRSGYTTHGDTITPPGPVTFTLDQLLRSAGEFLEAVRAPFWLYAVQRERGKAGVFASWRRGACVGHCRVTDNPMQNIAARDNDDASTFNWNITGWPPRVDVRRFTTSRRTTSEALAANAISALKTLRSDPAGPLLTNGDYQVIACDGAAGTANIQRSTDGGITWAACAADPFAATYDALAIEYFEVGENTFRILAARETNPAAPCLVAYSDNNGATWTTVTVGATNGEAVAGPNGLFALDAEHIWLGTDSGNIYFSEDGGESWAVQSALGATGGADVNCINFCDDMIGYAVCDADVVIKTTDGGVNWAAVTATGLGVNLLSVWCFSENRIIVGSAIVAAGSLVGSWDGGATYEHLPFTGQGTETVSAMSFFTENVGVIVTNTAGPVGSFHHTIDGGNSWREVDMPTNVGINDVDLFDVNSAAFCGEVQAATAMIGRASG